MKFWKAFSLANLLALFALNAFAGYVELDVGERRSLPSCGGTVRVNNGGNDNQLNIVFSNVVDCSNVSLADGRHYKMKQPQGQRNGSYTIALADNLPSGRYYKTIELHSDSGKHSDTIRVYFVVTGGYDDLDEDPSLPPVEVGGGW